MSILGRPSYECGPDDMGRSDAITHESEQIIADLDACLTKGRRSLFATCLATAIEEESTDRGADLIGLIARSIYASNADLPNLQMRISNSIAQIFEDVVRNHATEIVDDRLRRGARFAEAA